MNKRKRSGLRRRLQRINRIPVYLLTTAFVWISLLPPVQSVESDTIPDAQVRLLLADFKCDTGSLETAAQLKPILRSILQQSPRLTIYPERKIRPFSEQDPRAAGEGQIRELARHFCLEEGIPIAILPGIEILDGSLVISARILHVEDNRESFVDTIRVSNMDRLAAILEELGRRIRVRLGESLDSPAMSGNVYSTDTSFSTLKLFSESFLFHASGNRQGSIDALKRILEENPGMAVARLHLGLYYFHQQQDAKALAQITEAQAIPGDLPLRYRYLLDGIHHFLLQRYRTAYDHFLAYTEAFPSDRQAHYFFARCATAIGNYPLSIEEYHKAIQLDDTRIESYLGLCMALLYNRNPKEAKSVLDRNSALDPDHPEIPITSGLLELIDNNPRFAIEAFRKAEQFPLYQSRVSFLLAQADIYAGKFRNALKILASGIEEDSNSGNVTAEASKRLVRAQLHVALGNMAAAVDEIRNIPVPENDPLFLSRLGSLQAAVGEKTAAEENLKQLRTLSPYPYIQALADRLEGEILMADRRFEEAIPLFTRSKVAIPTPSIPLAHALMNMEQWESAVSEFNDIQESKAVLLFPLHQPWFMGDWVQAIFDAGQCNLKSGRPMEAKQYFRQYLWIMEQADSSLNLVNEAEVLLTGRPIYRSGQ